MMNRGGIIICGATALIAAGCANEPGELEIRAQHSPLARGERPVPFRIAEARGQLLTGNVALALESFRKAQREDPASIDALTGIAECYQRMGRFDLSRRHYEQALALAPGDAGLLEAFAKALEQQGKSIEAASIRSEIAQRLAAASPAPATEPATVTALAELQSPGDDGGEQSRTIAISAPEIAPSPIRIAVPVQAAIAVAETAKVAVPALQIAIAAADAVSEQPQRPESALSRQALAAAEMARSVTIELPAPKPASAGARSGKDDERGPRLVRLSMGEVALVTVPGAHWASELVSQSARSTTVRFVPLQPSETVAEVRLLNAARVHRLAARTRAYLRGHGWRKVAIGDADSTRESSIVFYPKEQRPLANRLAKQFGFAMVPRDDYREVTVLLGRDSVGIAGVRAGA